VVGGDVAQLRQQRDYFLRELANEYLRTRRTDEKAMQVLELLAQDAQCEPRLLTALAMVYALNHRWGKLKKLATRLEREGDNGR
jgi:lipopolysaccharide biosynthesis regulator YciM